MDWPYEDLLRFVTSLVGPQDAEDIVQDVAVKLLERYAPPMNTRTWCFIVAKHAAINHLKHRGRQLTVSLADLTTEPSTIDPTDQRERLWDASKACEALTPEETDWLAAYTYYGSRRAAADAVGMGREAFRTRIRHILTKLQQTEEDV